MTAATVWSTLALANGAQAQEPDNSWIDREGLRAGEILVSFGDDNRFRGVIKAAVLIDADPRSIWEILRDCESAPEYVPHVLSCELIETRDDGRTEVFQQEVKYVWFLPQFGHVFSMRSRPYDRIEVQRVAGPIEHLESVWRLLPSADDKTLLTYDLELRPGMPVPRFMIGASLRRDIPIILTEVRKRAETVASGDNRQTL